MTGNNVTHLCAVSWKPRASHHPSPGRQRVVIKPGRIDPRNETSRAIVTLVTMTRLVDRVIDGVVSIQNVLGIGNFFHPDELAFMKARFFAAIQNSGKKHGSPI